MNNIETTEPPKPNWIVRITLVLVVAGGLVYGSLWFMESSRLSERQAEFLTEANDVFDGLEEQARQWTWGEAAGDQWRSLIDNTADLEGTRAEAAHRLARDLGDALEGRFTELAEFDSRAREVLDLLNTQPESALAEVELVGGVEIILVQVVTYADGTQRSIPLTSPEDDMYQWDDDLALLEAIEAGAGPRIIERLSALDEEAAALEDSVGEFNRAVWAQIAQSDLGEEHRRRLGADWNRFASSFAESTELYLRRHRQSYEAYDAYVDYLLDRFSRGELEPDRLREITPRIKSRMSELRGEINEPRY